MFAFVFERICFISERPDGENEESLNVFLTIFYLFIFY